MSSNISDKILVEGAFAMGDRASKAAVFQTLFDARIGQKARKRYPPFVTPLLEQV